MSKRYVVTKKNGSLEDWGADSIGFTSQHILFLDNGEMTHAILAEDVREIEVEDEG